MSFDYVPGTPYEIEQDHSMFCMTSDSTFLGSFLQLKKHQSILDVGCNNGVLLCYTNLFEPKELFGIDIEEKAIELAQKNMDHNQISAHFECVPFQSFQHEPFDVILCNPPYFHPVENAYSSSKQHARYHDFLSLVDLFEGTKRLLKSNGTFHMIYRANYFNDIMNVAMDYGFRPRKIQFGYPNEHAKAKTVCVSFCLLKNVECEILPPYLYQ